MDNLESLKKRQYYIKNKEQILKKARERYAKEHPRKYARCYQITTPDNVVIYKDTFIEVSEFFGYSEPKVKKLWKENALFGYEVKKIF